jgi:hypothetical protein
MAQAWEMLKRVFGFKEELQMLMEGKWKAIAELNDGEWICEFVFVVDVATHFYELNTLFQNKGRLISSMIDSSKDFNIKLCLGISVEINESRAFSSYAELAPFWGTCWRINTTYFPFSDGGCFQVGGYVNSKSNRHFMLNLKVPSHVDRVSEWCTYC